MKKLLLSITTRIMVFNGLILFVLAVAFLGFDRYETQLLASQERAMVQQGRLMASVLSGRESLNADEARRVLAQLRGRTEARIRVIDKDGVLLADSSGVALPPPDPEPEPDTRYEAASAEMEETPDYREDFLYRLAMVPVRLYRGIFPGEMDDREAAFYRSESYLQGAEVRAALAGRYGAATRVSQGQRSVTLYSAIPITAAGSEIRTLGAVLVSQSTYRILIDIYEIRLATFRIFVAALISAAVISFLVSLTITRPLGRLSRQAAALARGEGSLEEFPYRKNHDEVGVLSRSFAGLTEKLKAQISYMERFTADVSHEFKNPLASLVSTAELLEGADDPAERRVLVSQIHREAGRLNRLLRDLRELSLAEEAPGAEARGIITPADPLWAELRGRYTAQAEEQGIRLIWQISSLGEAHSREVPAEGLIPLLPLRPESLRRVLINALDNAFSFCEAPGEVSLTLARETHGGENQICLAVENTGPPVPEEVLGRVFRRFYSYRPGGADGGHSGLGLAIIQALVEPRGGRAVLENTDSGVRLRITFPA